MNCDIAIVGGGIAGTIAALRAAELGLRVVVLERGDGATYPCNTRYSGGILHLNFRDPKREPGQLAEVLAEGSDGGMSPDFVQLLSTDGARLIDWLRGHDIKFVRFNALEATKWCMAPPRAMIPGLDWKGRGPDEMLRKLAARTAALGGRLITGSRVDELVMTNGRCTGLAYTRKGALEHLSAGAVILSDGGFQANRELFERYIGPAFDKVLQRGAATGTGDGLKMALAVGAASAGDLSRFYGHLLSADAFTNDKVWPYPELDDVAASSIVVDGRGRRFADEGKGGIHLANQIARRDDPLQFSIVLDSAIWEGSGRLARIPPNPTLERGGGTVHRAESIESLARQLDLDAATLRNTITEYNDALRDNRLDQLTIPRTAEFHKPMPILQPPFIGLRICVGITYTMAGIAIDSRGSVLRADGSPIDGLYAAGTTTGGIEGYGRTGYVGGLTKSGVLGLNAGENAANYIQSLH